MTPDLSSFNENQREAVQWQDGPLLVLAGPGSGKTRVLTHRIARIISETPDKHFRILGLTFTNKAAAEMRERIETLVPNANERTHLTTFHSFAADLLRQHGHHINLRPDFTILSQDTDRQILLDEAIDEVNKSTTEAEIKYSGEKLLPLITRLLDRSVTSDDVTNVLSSNKISEPEVIGAIYTAYRNRMIKDNKLDFGGLLAQAYSLLEQKPAVRKQIYKIYPYVCVDEFQDTNLSQYRILEHLVNPSTRNLFVVADDDQIIYQWNGASPERLYALRNDFKMRLLQLPENYRCPPQVIDIANGLIVHNIGRSEDKERLRARKAGDEQTPIRIMDFDTFEQEAKWVAKDLADRPINERGKCVVLARTRRLLEHIIRVLVDEEQVPAYLAMRKNEFIGAPMRWLHAVLRLANARQDREQLRRVCKAFFTLEGIDLNVKDIMSFASTDEGDYLRAWRKAILQQDGLEQHSRDFLVKSIPVLSDRLDFDRFISDAFEWFERLPENSPETWEHFTEFTEEKKTWQALVNDIMSQYGREQVTLHLLLQELDLRSKAPTPPNNAVPCFTIHASKGMEFDHVYLIGMVEDELPSWAAVKKGNDSREMQEERRNCFVAITRVQESLTVSYSREVFGWPKTPSRFLKEMGCLVLQE